MSLASESVNDVWNTIWVGVVGEIWNQRNSIVFNRGVADALEVCFDASKSVVLDFCEIAFCLFSFFPASVWNLWNV